MAIVFKKRCREAENIDWPDHVVPLDENSFDDFIRKYPLSVVDFYADWCQPCKVMYPRMRKLSKAYKGKVAFGRVNVQEEKNLAKKFKVVGVPTFIFFSYGKKLLSISGTRSVGNMKEIIEKLLGRIR